MPGIIGMRYWDYRHGPLCPALIFVFLVETGFCHVGQAGLKPRPQMIHPPWLPKMLKLQVWARPYFFQQFFCSFQCMCLMPLWLNLFLGIFSDAIVNAIVFLISFLNCPLLVYGNITDDLCLLSLHPATLLNLFIN